MEAVKAGGHRLGVAFDGDGDRCLLVDHNGQVVDGDAILLLCALHLKRHGELKGNTVVATVMSNLGLEIALKEAGIELVRTPVGDKHVADAIVRQGFNLGGEQSGHVIFTDFLFTGDGIVTALNVLRVMADTGRELADLAGVYVKYPQVLLNVRVAKKVPVEHVPAFVDAVAEAEAALAGHGRLLVRYSGTEPLLRIMLEGRDQAEIHGWAEQLAAVAREHIK